VSAVGRSSSTRVAFSVTGVPHPTFYNLRDNVRGKSLILSKISRIFAIAFEKPPWLAVG
jgi:hypothetical protein